MNNIITVFATDADLSVDFDFPFIIDVLFILATVLPYIAIIVSLICMIVRKWEVAAVISISVTLFVVAYMGVDSIITIFLLAYSALVCGIAIFVSKKKRLSPQQEETSESFIEEIDNSYKLEDKDDDWDFL